MIERVRFAVEGGPGGWYMRRMRDQLTKVSSILRSANGRMMVDDTYDNTPGFTTEDYIEMQILPPEQEERDG